MSNPVEQAVNAVYEALANDNKEIDQCIAQLKAALKEAGQKDAVFDAERLAQNNREGRKRMQSYFKKRGVNVVFK